MATISSHVLDSVIGDHAKQIGIDCFRIKGEQRESVFSVIANEEGRIVENVKGHVAGDVYEVVFKSADYFASQPNTSPSRQIMHEIVVRFTIPEQEERIHIPIMLSPHAYSVWWSS